MVTLYARAGLLESLVPGLVGLELPDRWCGFAYGSHPPILQCVGGRGTGKTAVLKGLSEAYSQRVPQAYVDLAAPRLDLENQNASPVTDLLFILCYQLGRDARNFGKPLSFPRTVKGLQAVTSWGQAEESDTGAGGSQSPSSTKERLREILLGDSQPDEQQRVEALIRAVTSQVAQLTGLQGVLGAVVQVGVNVAGQELSARAQGGALTWWERQRVVPQGNGVQQLVALAEQFHNRGESRRAAERHLVAALLADIAGYYGWWRTSNRVPRPLALLDNTHTEHGRYFLQLLQKAQDEAAGHGRPVPLALVTTALGDETAYPSVATVTTGPGWQRPELPDAEGWLFRLGLSPLEIEDIRRMFGRKIPPAGLPSLIHRLSAGRAGVARALARAAERQLHAGTELRLERLLDLPDGDNPELTVTTRLLEQLVPEEHERTWLIRCSPALDDPSADALSHVFRSTEVRGTEVQEAKAYLRRNAWRHDSWPGTDVPFVGDRTLRTLVLHELASSSADGETWMRLHRRLRSRYGERSPGEHAVPDWRYLHHSVALGETELVARDLHRRFTEGDARSVLAAVNLVCAAPHPPGDADTPPADTASCPSCLHGERRAHQAIARLVENLWHQSAPLALPDEQTIQRVSFQLNILAEHSETAGQEVFFRAHQEWPRHLRGWVQAPDLPTLGGPGP